MSTFELSAEQDIVITAGGTREKIDDVRYIGNFSSGRFGLAIAQKWAECGRQALLIAPQSAIDRFGLPDKVTHIPYDSAEDLQNRILSLKSANVIVHAAAVSDYTPVKTEGKISSDQDSLTITLKRTPKILKLLRPHFGEDTIIAGFKLLSGSSNKELIQAATAQIETCQTDICIANDLQSIQPEQREITYVVPPKNIILDENQDDFFYLDRKSYYSRQAKGTTEQVADYITQSIVSLEWARKYNEKTMS